MARALNKNRIRDFRIASILLLALILISNTAIAQHQMWDALFEMAGSLLVGICIIGRIYTSAFIGGRKNAALITYGPFSVVRNPLYVFSFIGVIGIGLISDNLVVLALLCSIFALLYHPLIQREENFLQEAFGAEYTDYCARTPRLLPNFALYYAPEEVPMSPRFLNRAIFDAIWWMLALPLFELIEHLHASGRLITLFTFP